MIRLTGPNGDRTQFVQLGQLGIHPQIDTGPGGVDLAGRRQPVMGIDGIEDDLRRQAEVDQAGIIELDQHPLRALSQQQCLVNAFDLE